MKSLKNHQQLEQIGLSFIPIGKLFIPLFVKINFNKRYNPVLAGLDSFKKALETKNSPPEGLVVGGLQMMGR